ncbi:LysE family translocator [Spartinivicinus poritis]|uniref:LysE family translocator n=1 Tax=Spartinivicinus poritis TaxID=2994640 RepID=A0ABT5U4K4_9GAMM|nr:LysE family translocator [Spartinivicinus sp. A2-2]MDE1461288.1 LysE family translocator [Spartinivicinus sp. A2-2]
MDIQLIIVYTMVSFFYIISPGPAVFLAITNGVTTNLNTVAISSAGNVLGLLLLSTVSMLGLGALLLSSALLFSTVKIVGAAYLIYLGVKQFLIARSIRVLNTPEALPKRSALSYFTESFIVAATNPKPILFFVALFPQFLNVQHALLPQFLVLTGIFMLLSFISLLSYGFISKSAKGLLAKRVFMQWFHRITGGLFIMMGLSLLKLKNSQA